ncbi:MAG: TIR domain-containing protein [Chloroflexota bacterium]
MAFIFVSYSRKDRDFVKRLVGDLRKLGIPIWLDTKDIAPGERWDTAIEHALDKSTHVLFVMSVDSTVSNNVRDELDTALDSGKIIIPILLNDCTPPLRTRRLEYIDFRGDYDQALEELFEKLPQETKSEISSIRATVPTRPLAAPSAKQAATNGAQPIRQIALGVGVVILIVAGLIGAFALGSRKGGVVLLPTPTLESAQVESPTFTESAATLLPIVPTATETTVEVLPTETFTATLLTDTPPPLPTDTETPTADVPTSTSPADTPTETPTTSSTGSPFSTTLTGWKPSGKNGKWDIIEGGLQVMSDGNADAFYVADNDDSDFSFDTTFIIHEGSNIASAGVVLRSVANPFDGCYLVRVSVANGGQINIVKFFNGNQYKQLDLQHPHIDFGIPYTIRVTVKTNLITVYLNEQEILTAQDSTFTHGAVGLNVYGGTALFQTANLTLETDQGTFVSVTPKSP